MGNVIKTTACLWFTLAHCSATSMAIASSNALGREFDRLTARVVEGAPGQSLAMEIPVAIVLAARFEKAGNYAKQGATLVTAANLAHLSGRYREAAAFGDRAAAICARVNDRICVGRAANTAAVALGRIDDPYGAMRRLRRAATMFKLGGRADYASISRMNAAKIQADLGDTTGALAEYRAIDAAHEDPDDPHRAGILTTIGNLLIGSGQPEAAKASALEAMRVLGAAKTKDRKGWSSDQELAALETLGLAEAEAGNAGAAMRALNAYLKRAAAGDSSFERFESNYAMARGLELLGRAADAGPYLQRAVLLQEEADGAGRLRLYRVATAVAKAQGDYRTALIWLERAQEAQTKQLEAQLRSSLSDAAAQIKLAKRDATLSQNARLASEELWRTRALAMTLVAFALLIGVLAVARTRARALRRRQEAVLEERSRMARDVHDSILQGMAGLSMGLQAVRRTLASEPDKIDASLDLLVSDAQLSLAKARDAVWDLRRPDSRSADFSTVLEDLACQLGENGQRQIEVNVAGAWHDQPPALRSAALRIIEEAGRNAVQHGQASMIGIDAVADADGAVVMIKDNGRGFAVQPDLASLGGHWGVLGMRERAEALGGTLDVASSQGAGTVVTATLPRFGA